MPNGRSVFISYSGNRDSVRQVAEMIEAHGDIPWFDESLQGGQRWWDQILDKIRGCDIFVFFMSPRSSDSVPCYFELNYASQLGRPLVPVFMEPIAPDQRIPEALLPIQWTNVATNIPENRTKFHAVLDRVGLVPLPAQLVKPPVLPDFGQRRITFKDLEAIHQRLESLAAVYSVVAWRSERQQPPRIKQDSEFGGDDFVLDCDHAAWGSESKHAELFSCFVEDVAHSVEGEEFLAPRLTANEDYYYQFEWHSLFGTLLSVEINPSRHETELYALRDERADEIKSAEEEGASPFAVYAVEIKGLPASRSVQFIAAQGYYDWFQNGSVSSVDGWVVYLPGSQRIALDSIESLIQQAASFDPKVANLQQAVDAIRDGWSTRNVPYLERLVEIQGPLIEKLGSAAN